MELESGNGSDLNKYARLNENSKILESNPTDEDVNDDEINERKKYYLSKFCLFWTKKDLLNELLDEEIPPHIREARLNELKMKAREQQYMQQNNHSIYQLVFCYLFFSYFWKYD